jgi:hypothetical protein
VFSFFRRISNGGEPGTCPAPREPDSPHGAHAGVRWSARVCSSHDARVVRGEHGVVCSMAGEEGAKAARPSVIVLLYNEENRKRGETL